MKYLHDYFQPKKYQDRIAVLYDDSKGPEKRLSYTEVDAVAEVLRGWIATAGTTGFVGVFHCMNQFFPSILIGVMRSGCATFNIGFRDWEKSLQSARKILHLRLLILDEITYLKHQTWVESNCSKETLLKYDSDRMHASFHLIFLAELDEGVDLSHMKSLNNPKPFDFAYAMQTSGTTASKKWVLVPHTCITPNIEEFTRSIYEVDVTDVVMGCSPSTFDPSVVDLFATFAGGGSVLYVNEQLKLDGLKFGILMKKHKVSVLQITPSLFRKIGDGLKSSKFFDPDISNLKVLALGGEKCLSKAELRDSIDERMYYKLRRIVTLYGLTEVSCWASFGLVNPFDEDPICIGVNMLETDVFLEPVTNNNSENCREIIIASNTRSCFVLDHFGDVSGNAAPDEIDSPYIFKFKTGDLGYLNSAHPSTLSFSGRKDRVVKKNGIKIPLVVIEDMAMRSDAVKSAECVVEDSKIYLVVVIKEQHSSVLGLGKKVRAKVIPGLHFDISPQFYPDCIIGIHSVPVNENRKLDIRGILDYAKSHHYPAPGEYSISEPTVIRALHPVWMHATGNRGDIQLKQILKERFFQVGGDSATAAWFVENAFTVLNLFGTKLHEELETLVLQKLFFSSFKTTCNYLAKSISSHPLKTKIGLVSSQKIQSGKEKALPLRDDPLNLLLKKLTLKMILQSQDLASTSRPRFNKEMRNPVMSVFVKQYELRMCVDASPCISFTGLKRGVLVVGSHAGVIVAVDLCQLRKQIEVSEWNGSNMFFGVLWAEKIPGRVEAEGVFSSDSTAIFICSHDHKIYKMSTVNGSIEATFTCEGSIRTKPTTSRTIFDESLLVIDDTSTVYCLKSLNLQCLWITKVESGVLSSSYPVVSQEAVFVSTMREGLIALSMKDGCKIWSHDEDLSISLTAPLILVDKQSPSSSNNIITTTESSIESRDCKSGKIVWKYTERNIWKKGVPFVPIVHNCKFNLSIEIVNTSSSGKILVLNNSGNKLRETVSEKLELSPTLLSTCQTVEDSSTNVQCQCYLLCRPASRPVFLLHRLHNWTLEILMLDFQIDYKVFSVSRTYEEFLAFGGRDNMLHVISFQPVTKQIAC